MLDKTGVCPCCGQRMLIRHGILLSPKLADIFDLIERSGRRGVLPDVLASVFYPNHPNKAARRALAVSISHINDRFSATDVRVKMDGRVDEPYRVVRMTNGGSSDVAGRTVAIRCQVRA